METKTNYTIVGAFVIILVAAIVLGIIWLSSGFSFERYTSYLVYMQESVSGLSIDAPVEYNGVRVGTVDNIELNRENPQLVEVILNISTSTPITRGTVATLNTRGLTGITYIALKDKSTDLRPLVLLPGQKYPVIPTAPSIFVRLDTALTMLTKNFHQMSDSIQKLLSNENQESIKNILLNLQQITTEISSNNSRLTQILTNTERLTAQFTPLVQSSTGTMHMLETQTLPAAYQLINNLDDATRTLSGVVIEIKQNPSVLIRGIDRQKLGPGETK